MRYCGIVENFHNAAICFIEEDGTISFASESERFSKKKNDALLHPYFHGLIKDDDHISFYEDMELRDKHLDPILKSLPQYSKEFEEKYLIRLDDFKKKRPYHYEKFYTHHESHGAGAFYTRPWDTSTDTVIMTIDGFGEYQSATIMDSNFNLLYEKKYPDSIGFLYAMATKALGLKALQEEYIVMGMAAYGQPSFLEEIENIANDCADTPINAFMGSIILDKFKEYVETAKYDFACSIQALAEKEIMKLAVIARGYGSKLCYSGGVAQNIVANSKIRPLFQDMWIAINPTDGGSSIGSAARTWGLANNKNKIEWKNPYLGYEMGEINATEVVDHLLEYSYCGIASGCAEFGPRALGNRSLIADPRRDIKDTVNQVKRRQKFRPFAPAILEEYANEYFEGPMNEYMQYSCDAKHDYKSVTHVDGTARVQIVRKDNPSILRKILEEFYEKTSVPMLLNTSLNIRGRPIVNDRYDCFLFEKLNKTRVFYNDID